RYNFRRLMRHTIYNKVARSTGILTVFLGEEKISQGSCFCFLDSGEVLTAAHVVTGRFPIQQDDVNDPEAKYFVKFANVPVLEYKVKFCAITIQVEAFKEPIQIDLALLKPKQDFDVSYPAISANVNPPNLGDEVLIAGYSDEIELPFLVDKIIDRDYSGVREFFDAMDKGYLADMTGPMIKRAYVGNHRTIIAGQSESGIELQCDVMYLDNGMHSGASGGPVVNMSGDVVGIITQRAVTKASQSEVPSLVVPSGSTVAMSLKPLLAIGAMMAK
ncbi:S1 family peptidase, partial [Vibrio vulnificus]